MGGSCLDFTENRLKDFRNVSGFYTPCNQILRGAKNEILNEEQINFVPVGWKFFRLAEMALQKKTEAILTRHGRGGKEMPKVDSLYLAVHLIQPKKVAVPRSFVGPRANFCPRRIWSADEIELTRQCFIDRIQPAKIFPCLGHLGRNRIRLPRAALVCGKRFHD